MRCLPEDLINWMNLVLSNLHTDVHKNVEYILQNLSVFMPKARFESTVWSYDL